MNSIKNSILATFAIIVSVATGCASSKPDSHEKVNQFDSDGDGYLTPEEYSASALSDVVEFDSLDADGDGLLSQEELEIRVGQGSRERGPRGDKGGRPSRKNAV